MGIKNLLRYLKPITRSINISQLSGKKCAVDGYCWYLNHEILGCINLFILVRLISQWEKMKQSIILRLF